MRIAIPMAEGKLSMHFGHCEQFALLDVDTQTKTIVGRKDVDPPAHEPGILPPWLAGQGVHLVITGGMGQRAQQMFMAQGIKVLVGASSEAPERIVAEYLAGTLQVGGNVCDH